ncbi:YjbQ family protein [Candidatus Bathyarchaeota archaeon]|nr:YjbQ family protein [Candidatus Bathyarchaeota archaeon]RJS78943.1 MAG: YjbQ family protein [Candidatus Bathyarchaeota archaeon]
MKVLFKEIQIQTNERTEIIDITGKVEDIINRSEITNGLCVIHTVHSTAAIIINEHEKGLKKDIVRKIREDFPKDAGWLHNEVDDNADAHLASTYIGPTKIFPIQRGKIIRGPWQNIFLLELDGPRTRRVMVEIIGE